MDPLSVAASAIAITQAVNAGIKCIQRLRAIRKAPEEIQRLLEEVTDVNKLLEQIASTVNRTPEHGGGDGDSTGSYLHGVSGEFETPPPPAYSEHANSLDWQLKRTSSKLQELDDLVQQFTPVSPVSPESPGTDDRSFRSNASSAWNTARAHSGWLRGRQKAKTIQEELTAIRLNLTASLGASTSSAVARVESAVEKITLNQTETTKLLTTFINSLSISRDLEVVKEDHSISISMTRHAPRDLRGPAGDTPKPNTMLVHATRPNNSKCKAWCSCSCHSKKALRVKRPFTPANASFSVNANGLPWLTAKCDEKSCKGASTASVSMTIQLPTWLWNRYISASLTCTPMFGPEVNLKMPRVVSWYSTIWAEAINGNLAKFQEMFASGEASPWDVSPIGGSLLHYAADHRHFDLCRFLVSQGAPLLIEDDFNQNPTEQAWDQALTGRLNSEDEYAVASIFSSADYIDSREFTVLHKIVLGLISRSVRSELEASTKDIDAQDASGRTCVFWAAARGDAASLQALLEFKADPNIPDIQGNPPIHRVKTPECVSLLLKHGADLHQRNGFGCTALHQICRGDGDVSVLKALVDAGADVNALDGTRESTLVNASLAKYTRCANYLIDSGADVSLRTKSGETALHFAITFHAHSILRRLVGMNPVDVDVGYSLKNSGEQTILHLAAKFSDAETLRILKTAKGVQVVDTAAKDHEEKTAWDLFEARDFGSDEKTRVEIRTLIEDLLDRKGKRAELGTVVVESLLVDTDEDLKKDRITTSVTPLAGELDDDYEDIVTGDDDFHDAIEHIHPAEAVEILVAA